MPLLLEIAITPDVFDLSAYSSEELADSRFDLLRELTFNDAIVRNLSDGKWKDIFSDPNRTWYRRGGELVRKLETQGRLRDFQRMYQGVPTSDAEWCNEALASHGIEELDGIISSKSTAALHGDTKIVAAISKLSRSDLWRSRTQSVRPDRHLKSYLQHLNPIFTHAKHLMFIDPYLDPYADNYTDFPKLLREAMLKKSMPLIEIHRTINDGKHGIPTNREWERRFREKLLPILPQDAEVEIFLWDEMHDRYLISNILGIDIPHGFDTSGRKEDITTWSRLSKDASDDIRREYDANSVRHKLQHRFIVRKK